MLLELVIVREDTARRQLLDFGLAIVIPVPRVGVSALTVLTMISTRKEEERTSRQHTASSSRAMAVPCR